MSKQKYRDLLLGLGLLFAAMALVIWPRQAMEAMRDGLALCGNVIIPSLFPFFVLSSMVVDLGMSRYLGKLLEPIMAPLFRVNGSCATALALGFVGGYPVGARTAISLYQSGQCSRTEAERMLAFCNNCGPAFILGVVGAGVFSSGAIGLLLYLGHISASLLIGLLFRFYKPGEGPRSKWKAGAQFQTASLPVAFTRSVTGAFQSTLNICAFILFFTVAIRILTISGFLTTLASLLSCLLAPLGLSEIWAERLLTGILEVSSGVSSLTDGALSGRLSMAAFMLGWAGVSVHCQVMAFLGDSGLSLRTYVVGKLLHGGLSALIVGLLIRVLPIQSTVSTYLAEQTEAIANLDFHRALTISAVAAWGVWLVFLALAVYIVKKSSGKRGRYAL
ncbi:MAG: nucleoside recognition domain-containing protein [Lawsonibacter sp.]